MKKRAIPITTSRHRREKPVKGYLTRAQQDELLLASKAEPDLQKRNKMLSAVFQSFNGYFFRVLDRMLRYGRFEWVDWESMAGEIFMLAYHHWKPEKGKFQSLLGFKIMELTGPSKEKKYEEFHRELVRGMDDYVLGFETHHGSAEEQYMAEEEFRLYVGKIRKLLTKEEYKAFVHYFTAEAGERRKDGTPWKLHLRALKAASEKLIPGAI